MLEVKTNGAEKAPAEPAIEPELLQKALGAIAELIEHASRTKASERFAVMFRLAKIASALEREGATGVEAFACDDDDMMMDIAMPRRRRIRNVAAYANPFGVEGIDGIDAGRNLAMLAQSVAAQVTSQQRARELRDLEEARCATKRRKGDTKDIDARIATLMREMNPTVLEPLPTAEPPGDSTCDGTSPVSTAT